MTVLVSAMVGAILGVLAAEIVFRCLLFLLRLVLDPEGLW